MLSEHENNQNKITGVILAGGLAKRMNNQDKGLINYNKQPLVTYAITALSTITKHILINANRNREAYLSFGFPVIADQTEDFQGPLAGILTAMLNTDAVILVIAPCDSPLIKGEHLQKILTALTENDVDVAVAFDGKRLHPIFLALRRSLKNNLQDYLDSGQRKVLNWLNQQNMIKVNFEDEPEIFVNINTLTELAELEEFMPSP
jgi:molybdopterin-guanine dinucleotide biosynthesis protein A